jgi:hypothetical protein
VCVREIEQGERGRQRGCMRGCVREVVSDRLRASSCMRVCVHGSRACMVRIYHTCTLIVVDDDDDETGDETNDEKWRDPMCVEESSLVSSHESS